MNAFFRSPFHLTLTIAVLVLFGASTFGIEGEFVNTDTINLGKKVAEMQKDPELKRMSLESAKLMSESEVGIYNFHGRWGLKAE